MSSCPSRTFPFSVAEAGSICQKLATEAGVHIDPTQTSGSTETHGVQINWLIQGDAITISIPSKPWIIPCSQIFDELDKLFSASST